ncbi:hypothetical protein I5E68_15390 [Novosphingobium sp. YJ-S2-02]|uniref:O-antigen ligase domain-containing protein n=1 Tax=Novosphingobium aureum TaxID=2792964 RepID=A0A931HF99_9SPHN|nr:hypothetical protein [Novosphingobium aureum]MBH0114328.1 hypothetical protein [Novosphingobium aureum]
MHKTANSRGLNWRLDWIVILNSLLMLVYHATGAEVIGLAGNAFSGVVVIALGFIVVGSVPVLTRYGWLLGLLGVGLVGTLTLNRGHVDPVDLLKYVSLFAFYFAALTSKQLARCSRYSAAALVLLPLILWPVGSRVWGGGALGGTSFSYFQTYNAAVLYFTAVLFYLYPLFGRIVLPMQLAIAIVFGKIGAILASAAAFTAWNLKINRTSIALLVAGSIVAAVAVMLGLLDRVFTVVGPFASDLYYVGPERISRMSYAEIVRMAGTTDISGYFRIKHWMEIWQEYTSGGFAQILFGFGPGQSKVITLQRLVPHNDYLRILAEFGLVNFICFLSLIFIALKRLPNSYLRSLFTVYAVYSLSENIIDNFTSVALLFGAAGLFGRKGVPQARVVEQVRSPADLEVLHELRPGADQAG